MIDCRLDSICATLASYKENIKNNSVSIPILPNVTYKFRLQLKDELFNWTNLEETANINREFIQNLMINKFNYQFSKFNQFQCH